MAVLMALRGPEGWPVTQQSEEGADIQDPQGGGCAPGGAGSPSKRPIEVGRQLWA